jgi:hypothetical protein
MRKEFITLHIILEMLRWNNKVMQLAQHEEWPQQWHLARV